MPRQGHHRICEPKVILLAVGMVLIGVLCVVAIADTGDAWLVVVTALAIASIALAIIIDLRGIISDNGRRRCHAGRDPAGCRRAATPYGGGRPHARGRGNLR
jgi:hypothetical protein